MHAKKALLAFLVAVLLVPASSSTITFTPSAEDTPMVAHDGSASLNFTATVTCDDVRDPSTVLNEGTYSEDVTITYPDGVEGSPASMTIDFDGTACLDPTATSVDSETQNLTVTPGPTVHGIIVHEVELVSGEDNGTVPFKVSYRTGYDFVYDEALFPHTLNKDENGEWETFEWTADLVVTANAETMVMMSIQSADKAKYGVVSGFFAAKPFLFPEENADKQRILSAEQLENGITHTVDFSYQPTAEEWDEDVVTFKTWGHHIPKSQATTVPQEVTWTFVNGEHEGNEVDCDEEVEDCEESSFLPGFETGVALVVLLGAAMIAARRRN